MYPDVVLPKQAHSGDAGFDVQAYEGRVLQAGTRVLVPTGIKLKIPKGYEVQVRPRSGLSLKTDLLIPNSPGTIDQGYRGECCVMLFNAGDRTLVIEKGERIAQFVVNKLPEIYISEVTEEEFLEDSTSRGEGGFGSTGVF